MSNHWKASQLQRPSFAPRYWSGWLAVAALWVLGKLPRSWGLLLVAPLGPLLRLLLAGRRRIAERNLAACLPEKSAAERKHLLRGCFAALARMLVEMAWSWDGQPEKLQPMVRMRGQEALRAQRESGRGLLVITAHVTSLELGACLFGRQFPGLGIYRPLGNPVLEWYQNRGRRHYASGMISKRDMLGAVRALRRGDLVWYAPDQDFGPQQSLFIPFFGVQAATLLATHRLPRMTRCDVVTMMPRYVAEEGIYEVVISPVLEQFPSTDPEADLARVNALLEAQIREAPEQYWWIHRRFKTRPEGEPDFYGRDARSAGGDES